jgi:hypothetical protein
VLVKCNANITMFGKLSFFYVLLTVSLTSLVFHYNSAVINYLPEARKDDGSHEKVSMK